MMKVRQKDIKNMVSFSQAVDATDFTSYEINNLRSKGVKVIAKSFGIYGMNGCLFQCDGKLYAITARSTNLFAIV